MLYMVYFTSKSSFSFANTMPMGGLLFAKDKNHVLIYPKSLVIRHSVTTSLETQDKKAPGWGRISLSIIKKE